jgi:hypothetical protein
MLPENAWQRVHRQPAVVADGPPSGHRWPGHRGYREQAVGLVIIVIAVRSLTLGDITRSQHDDLFDESSTTSLVIQTLLWTTAIVVVFSYLSMRRFNSQRCGELSVAISSAAFGVGRSGRNGLSP